MGSKLAQEPLFILFHKEKTLKLRSLALVLTILPLCSVREQGEKFSAQLQPTWGLGQAAVGYGPGQEVVSSPHQSKAFLVAAHGSAQHMSVLLLSSWSHGLRPKKVYAIVVVTPASVRVPIQRRLFRVSHRLQVKPKTFHVALIYVFVFHTLILRFLPCRRFVKFHSMTPSPSLVTCHMM